jgi:hypothetical protein
MKSADNRKTPEQWRASAAQASSTQAYNRCNEGVIEEYAHCT